MHQIDSVIGQVLYVIQDLYKTNQISISQRNEIKDTLIDPEDQRLSKLINKFKNDKDEQSLRTNLIRVVDDFSPLDIFEQTYSIASGGSPKHKINFQTEVNLSADLSQRSRVPLSQRKLKVETNPKWVQNRLPLNKKQNS